MNSTIDAALVIIDVQEKLLNVMHESEKLVANVSTLARAAGILDVPTIWCQQYPKALGKTPKAITKHLSSDSIDKMSFSCALSEEFTTKLSSLGVSDIILCGIETHVCVYQTARDLSRKGYNVEIVSDAVSSRTLENKQIAIERMRSEDITISSLEMTLFDLLGSADNPRFKEVAKLIK